MLVICNYCGKRYRIDERKMKGDQVRLRCKSCSHMITVRKDSPQSQTSPAAVATAAPEPKPPPYPPPPESASRKLEPKPHPKPVESAGTSFSGSTRLGPFPKRILLLLCIGLVPFCIFWSLAHNVAGGWIRADSDQRMAQSARVLLDQVDGWLDQNARVLQAAAQMPNIVSMIRLRQEPVLKAIQQTHPWMHQVFTVNADGMQKASSDGSPLRDDSGRSYYKGIVEGKSIAWEMLTSETSQKPALLLAFPITSGDSLVGVMAGIMTVGDISRKVAGWRRGDTGYAFLVDEQNKVVAHPAHDDKIFGKNLSSHPLISAFRRQNRPLGMEFTDSEGVSSIGHVHGNAFGWALAVAQRESEVYALLRSIRNAGLALLAATVLLVALAAWFFARRVAPPSDGAPEPPGA